MVFKNLCVLVLWIKITSALKGLKGVGGVSARGVGQRGDLVHE